MTTKTPSYAKKKAWKKAVIAHKMAAERTAKQTVVPVIVVPPDDMEGAAYLHPSYNGKRIAVTEGTHVLWTGQLGKRGLAVASINTHKGYTALDLRRFYRTVDDEYKPTAKGVRIPLEQATSLAHALMDHSNVGSFLPGV